MKKKLPLFVLEIALQLQHWSKFTQKTYFSEKVLRKVQMSCALELKPHLQNDNDLWKKNYRFMYWNLPYSYNIGQNLPKKSQ